MMHLLGHDENLQKSLRQPAQQVQCRFSDMGSIPGEPHNLRLPNDPPEAAGLIREFRDQEVRQYPYGRAPA